ncbi:MAG: putative sulfate exporter family transporter [Deltaproteobacteria bacterium]|nr:putative sulfate exporter family transporter [Deltaproteobacteria bacterium]
MSTEPSSPLSSEDWWSVWLGLGIFALSCFVFAGVDVMGWLAQVEVWTDPASAVRPASKDFAGLHPALSLIATYGFLLAVLTAVARFLGSKPREFAAAFTVVFWISWACYALGHQANIAATPDKMDKFGVSWSMNLTGEAGYILALIAGVIVGNFFPRFASRLTAATRPEWYIKTAIVIMGAALGVKAAQATGLAGTIIFRGLCAVVEAYLIYWAVVYYIARRFFGFSREWAAPLASGVSICGVSAAIATGAAIRARPVVPIMVSSLVVVFAVVELLVLPFVAQHFLYDEPMVAGAWMGLAVKTDGAAVASGAVVDGLVRAKALAVNGVDYKEGWILMTATTTKMFIDVFIGIWAFVLALIWCAKIDRREGQKISAGEIWRRFPKFVIGYVLTFAILLAVCIALPERGGEAKLAIAEANSLRVLFFAMTFFTIGLVSNFKKLWAEGIGKLAAVYLISLFGFIIWIGLGVSWIFFHGIMPPLAGK